MQLSLYADFSCRVLIYLAVKGAQKASIEEIAKAYGISQNHLVKVVHNLGRLGYVETSRGRGGGIRLAKDPSKVSLGQVIRDTEPGFALLECFDRATNTCPIIGPCGLRPLLGRALEAFLAELDKETLADAARNQRGLRAVLGVEERV